MGNITSEDTDTTGHNSCRKEHDANDSIQDNNSIILDSSCTVSDCKCLKHFIAVMMEYQEQNEDNGDEKNEYIQNVNISQLMDDFLHLSQHHDTDTEFEHIYNKLGGFCNIKHCKIFCRNNRHRRAFITSQSDHELKYKYEHIEDSYLYSILDKMHTYYCHCFDIGNAITIDQREMINKTVEDKKEDVEPEEFFVNKSLRNIYEIISNKPMNRMNRVNDKKYNQISSMMDHLTTNNTKMYDLGTYFKYAADEPEPHFFGMHPVTVCAIYSSLKEELTTNQISKISMEQYINEYKKAEIHFQSAFKKEYFTKMQIEHIFSLMIYCNFDSLQYEFSKTYREDNDTKHGMFYHLGKYLKASVLEFGTSITRGQIKRFFHGIGETLVFPQIVGAGNNGVNIYGPLSTSSSMTVAINFTNHMNGLVIVFGNGNIFKESPKYFSVSWLSDYGNEAECLFLQSIDAPFGVRNILQPKSGIEFEAILIALKQMEQLTNGSYLLSDIIDFSDAMSTLISDIICNQLSFVLSEYKQINELHCYAQKLINVYIKHKDEVLFQLDQIDYYKKSPLGLLFHEYCDWINLDLICILFPNVSRVELRNGVLSTLILDNILVHLSTKSPIKSIFFSELVEEESYVKLISKYQSKFEVLKFNLQCDEDGDGWDVIIKLDNK